MRIAVSLVAALALAAPAAAALPSNGLVVPARSLGGIRLGAPQAAVTARWGRDHGVCRNCPEPTWYFTYQRFQPQGVGVSFRRGRVDALFTIWQPPGWRTPAGLALGDDVTRVTTLYGALDRRECTGYYTLVLRGRGGVTEFYVAGDRLWGIGVSRAPVPCR